MPSGGYSDAATRGASGHLEEPIITGKITILKAGGGTKPGGTGVRHAKSPGVCRSQSSNPTC